MFGEFVERLAGIEAYQDAELAQQTFAARVVDRRYAAGLDRGITQSKSFFDSCMDTISLNTVLLYCVTVKAEHLFIYKVSRGYALSSLCGSQVE